MQRLLHDREEREHTGLFFMEGLRFVSQAWERDVEVEALVVAPELLTHPFGRQLVRVMRRAGVPYLEVTTEVFRGLALVGDPQGIGAVARQRWHALPEVRPTDGLCWVALETVQSPGNLGTIFRTAEAVGAAGAILVGSAIDPYHPATVRSTMGALFSQRLVRTTAAEFAAWKRQHPFLLVGTSPTAAADYRSIAYTPPVVLSMGWERQGLSREQQSLCDVVVRLPMVGRGDSLNLAVATGVMLYEIFNQRVAG
jgi:TrmH family RNA methyltransferase